MFTAINNHPDLREIHFTCCNDHVEGKYKGDGQAVWLYDKQNIQRLSFVNFNIRSLFSIEKVVAKNSKCYFVDLSGSGICHKRVMSLLNSCKTIRSIKLSNNGFIGDIEVVKKLALLVTKIHFIEGRKIEVLGVENFSEYIITVENICREKLSTFSKKLLIHLQELLSQGSSVAKFFSYHTKNYVVIQKLYKKLILFQEMVVEKKYSYIQLRNYFVAKINACINELRINESTNYLPQLIAFLQENNIDLGEDKVLTKEKLQCLHEEQKFFPFKNLGLT